MWYFLETTINKKETLIDLNVSYDKMTKYFFSDTEEKKFFDNVKFCGIAQKGFTDTLLSQTDTKQDMKVVGVGVRSNL